MAPLLATYLVFPFCENKSVSHSMFYFHALCVPSKNFYARDNGQARSKWRCREGWLGSKSNTSRPGLLSSRGRLGLGAHGSHALYLRNLDPSVSRCPRTAPPPPASPLSRSASQSRRPWAHVSLRRPLLLANVPAPLPWAPCFTCCSRSHTSPSRSLLFYCKL